MLVEMNAKQVMPKVAVNYHDKTRHTRVVQYSAKKQYVNLLTNMPGCVVEGSDPCCVCWKLEELLLEFLSWFKNEVASIFGGGTGSDLTYLVVL